MTITLTDAIRELIEPIVSSEGMELVNIDYVRESRGWVLRLYVDTAGGVTIDHCARLSRQLGDVLDVKDIVPHPYRLEVSSPGLNRILKKEKDFITYRGETITVKTSEPIEQRKNFQGKLLGYKEGTITMHVDNHEVIIPLPLITKAQLKYQFPDHKRNKQRKT
jgi:ribosome maturation factor RimP